MGLGTVSVMLLGFDGGLVATEVTFFEVLAWMGISTAVILLLRMLLAVLRCERSEPTG